MEAHTTQSAASGALRHTGADPVTQFKRAADAVSDEAHQLEVIRLDYDEDQERGVGESGEWLSGEERERASRFHRPVDRYRYRMVRIRLRQMLAERLDIPPARITLGCNRYGKPELVGHQAGSGWRFNLSYSMNGTRGLALCAFSRFGRIGVDVEAVRLLDDADRLALRFFSTQEYEAYRQLSSQERPLAFINGWTRKEAFVKALGTGLSFALADFDVSLVPGLPARLLRVGRMTGERSGWRLQSLGPAGGRVAAVVTERLGG